MDYPRIVGYLSRLCASRVLLRLTVQLQVTFKVPVATFSELYADAAREPTQDQDNQSSRSGTIR